MKSANLFTKVVAWLLCAMLVVGFMPAGAIAVDATDDWESDIDVVETEPPAGSSADNAILLNSLENTVTVEAGATVYYYGRFNGMEMTVNSMTGFEVIVDGVSTADVDGTVAMACGGNPRMPFTFAIKNNGAEANEYYVNFNYPEGTQDNPKDLVEGENTVTLEAGNMGYFFDYVAYSDGYVTFQITGFNGWQWAINNVTAGTYGDINTSEDDAYVYEQSFEYNSGDEYVIMANTFNAEDVYNAPAGDITITVSFIAGRGTEESPFHLNAQENYVNIAAGQTVYYQGYFSGMNMAVSGNEGFTVNYNGTDYADAYGSIEPIAVNSGSPRMPVIFSITNTTEEDGSYYIGFTYPEGSMNNPQDLWDGSNVHTFEAGEGAYYFDYVGYTNGYLTITVSGDCQWQYVINNLTAYEYGDKHYSDDEPVVNSQTFKYMAGDEYVIEIATYNPEDMWNTPAGEIDVQVTFVPGFGTEDSPYQLYELENVISIEEAPVYYTGRFGGMNMTVAGTGDFSVIMNGETYAANNGVVVIENLPGNNWMPPVFAIDGTGEFTVSFAFPAGHMENPAVAVLGDNAANIAAGTQGYYFTYTAEKAGDLIVTISGAANWTYVINNMTSFAYGDMQWSDSDPVVNPATIKVAAGDEIQIVVNGYDPENPWEAPAANLNVNLKYKEVVLPSGTSTLRLSGATLKLESDLTMKIMIHKDVFKSGAYTDVRLEVSMTNAKTGDVRTVIFADDYVVTGAYREYILTGISPRMMNDTISFNLYGTYEGQEYNFSMTYSVAQYAYIQLGSSKDPVFLTLLADLLNFGAAHQTYTNYNTENLVNANMTEKQKGYASTAAQSFENKLNARYEVIDNPTASFRGANVELSEKVEVQFFVAVSDLTGVTLEVTADGTTYSLEIDPSTYVAKGGYYVVNFSSVQAKQLRADITAKVCRDGVAISNTALYSVESYVANSIGSSNTKLVALLKMMMYYGDSAAAFFAK